MKKLISVLLLLTLCLGLLSACSTAKTNKVLNNAHWDMTKEELIEAEGKEHIIKGADDTVMNWMLTKELSHIFGDRTVSVGYVFIKEKLRNITVQIFVNDGESLADGMKATRAAMEKVYGASHGDDATAHWHTDNGTISFSTLKGTESFFVASFSSNTTEHQH